MTANVIAVILGLIHHHHYFAAEIVYKAAKAYFGIGY